MSPAELAWRRALAAFQQAKPEEKAQAREAEQRAFSAYLKDNAERLQERAEQ